MSYDHSNIFARILRGEIPTKTILDDDYFLAFHDINPCAPIHALVIPKGAYRDAYDFTVNADADMIVGFYKGIGKVIDTLGVKESGFRLVSNNGADAHQEVPHFHVHILGGGSLELTIQSPLNSSSIKKS